MQIGGLIAGLGNPGREYEGTRHNFGFLAVEALLDSCGDEARVSKLSGQRDPFALWRLSLRNPAGGRPPEWLLMTPLTYMNRSGEPVQRVAAYYRIAPQDILAVHDELDLPLGRMKLKKGGGNAGHNGLRSIQQSLGTPDFYRLRLGIGKGAGSGVSWVLGRFAGEERELLAKTLPAAARGIMLFLREGPQKAQQFCNGFAPDVQPESAARTL